MTLLALVFILLSAVVIAAALFFGVPALARETFQNRMADLAAEIEVHLSEGRLRRQPYTQNLREAAYFYAQHPGDASLRTVWMTYRVVVEEGVDLSKPERELHVFRQYSTKAEQYIASEVERRLADLCWTNSFRNTMFWLPLALMPMILRALVSHHYRRSDTIAQVETVLTHRGRYRADVLVPAAG